MSDLFNGWEYRNDKWTRFCLYQWGLGRKRVRFSLMGVGLGGGSFVNAQEKKSQITK